ncbi:unnamed protein product [Gordionus sp. m RMFG-2023]|uniref:excitatory amino acid transporter-like n=1 Tax=Gordionus sp. m RMFG-2023 TaxID=3053472 RepID=UPI0030DFF2E4
MPSFDHVKIMQTKIYGPVFKYFKANLLMVLTISSVVAGIILGFSLRQASLSEAGQKLLQFPGDIFRSMLTMILLPLIVSSLVIGVARLDPKVLGIIATRTFIYYISTTFIAVFTGMILVLIIDPGKPNNESKLRPPTKLITTFDAVLDLIRNLVPENLIRSTFQSQKTAYFIERTSSADVKYTRKIGYADNTNMLGIVVFSIVFGAILSSLGERSKILTSAFVILNDVIMKSITTIMWFSPLGIMCLIAYKIVMISDLNLMTKHLVKFMLTIILGLSIHLFFTLPLIYYTITRKNPFPFMKGMLLALITGLATASNSVALPISFQCAEKNLGIDQRITRIVLPIGSLFNMDGIALYEAVAALFIARLNDVNLGVDGILIISLAATFASVGTTSMPGMALNTMTMVLTSVNLPVSDMAVLLPIDWLLESLRTAANVLGDAFGAGIIEHLSKDQLHDFSLISLKNHAVVAMSPTSDQPKE